MKKLVSVLSALSLVALLSLTSCESSSNSFKVTFSEDADYAYLTVSTSATTNWSFIASPAFAYEAIGFNDPMSQKEDVAKYCAKNMSTLGLKQMTGSQEMGASKAAQKAVGGAGTYYMVVWAYKSGFDSDVTNVNSYKYTIE